MEGTATNRRDREGKMVQILSRLFSSSINLLKNVCVTKVTTEYPIKIVTTITTIMVWSLNVRNSFIVVEFLS
jgi:GTP cyclohydrolase II